MHKIPQIIKEKSMEDEMKFKDWMKEVDLNLEDICGISSADLPDVCYHDMYEDDIEAYEAAMKSWLYAASCAATRGEVEDCLSKNVGGV